MSRGDQSVKELLAEMHILRRQVAECRAAEEERAAERVELLRVNEALRREMAQREQEWARWCEARKLESLGTLAGGVAHDFNNHLTVVLGYTSLLLKPTSETPFGRPIQQIERAAERAAELVHQMLIYTGKGELEPQRIDLRRLVEEMAEPLRSSLSEGVELHVSSVEDQVTVDADAGQIRQALEHLIANANDAMEGAAGVVSLEVGTVEATRADLRKTYLEHALPSGELIYLEIADTGQGMDHETLGRLFDPFFTTRRTGRGLGLASVLGIVRSHGGTIKVESQEGEGSTFRILLPPAGKSA